MKNTITFNVKGGKLPDDFSVSMTVEIDATGVSPERMFAVCCGGQSTRVKLQGNYRALGAKKLLVMSTEIQHIHFDEIYASGGTQTTAVTLRTLLSLPLEEYLGQVDEHFGDLLNIDEATNIWNKKNQ